MDRHLVALVVTGAPLAARAIELAAAFTRAGHPTGICRSDSAAPWTGPIPMHQQPPPGRWCPRAVIGCPATFHTINAVAAGLNDTPPLMLLNDAIARGTPTLLVPSTAERLGRHPAWARSISTLTEAGVAWLDPTSGDRAPVTVPGGRAEDITAAFDPHWLITWLDEQGPTGGTGD